MEKPELSGWGVTTNENGVQIASVNRDQLVAFIRYTENLEIKANKLDLLEKQIEEFYCDENGEYSEENPVRKGYLGDMGEVVAMAFGWL